AINSDRENGLVRNASLNRMQGCVAGGRIASDKFRRQMLREPGGCSGGIQFRKALIGLQPPVLRNAAEASLMKQNAAIKITGRLERQSSCLCGKRNFFVILPAGKNAFGGEVINLKRCAGTANRYRYHSRAASQGRNPQLYRLLRRDDNRMLQAQIV